MSHYYSGKHKCDLEKKSTSCLPKLSPRANIFSQIIRFISKGRLPTYYYPRTQEYFKSEKSLIDERLRILSDAPWYVIHPFSIISLIRDFVIVHMFIVDFITSNLVNSFDLETDTPITSQFITVINEMCSVTYVINSLLCMTTGYVIEDSLSVELRPRKIVAKYLRSYAVVDLLLIMPTELFSQDSSLLSKTSVLASFLRLKGYVPHFAMTLKVLYRVPTAYVDVTLCFLFLFLLEHCFACFSASLWRLVPTNIHESRNGSTLYRTFVKSGQFTWMEQYIYHYHIALSHLAHAGRGRHGIYTNEECVFYTVVNVAAFFLRLYVVTLVWSLVKQANRSKIRYEHVMQQINDFANRKGLSQRLRFRLVAHIQQKYRGNVYKEQDFYASLSEHLRHEVKLQSCLYLFNTNTFYQSLPKWIAGEVMNKLQLRCYTPGEVVFSVDDPYDYMYVISKGTIAYYSPEGFEVGHFRDGEFVGLLGFLFDRQMFTVIVVEYTDMYVMSKASLARIRQKWPLFDRNLRDLAQKRLDYVCRRVEQSTKTYRAVCGMDEIIEQREYRYQPNV